MTTPAAMADAIPISLKTGLPVGRVLIAAGHCTEEFLQQALLAQSLIRDSLLSIEIAVDALRICVKEHFTLEQALKIVGWQPDSFGNENKLGQLMCAAGVINQRQLDDALRVFYTAGLPLARVLVRKGTITNLVAYAALSSQQLLRENKLTREQAIQALKAADASQATIEDDYIAGYLRMSPSNTLRLGELLILAKLISEDSLISAVESALEKGETLGERLLTMGLLGRDTMERALEAQKLVTKGDLDVAKAGDILRKADYARMPIRRALETESPAVLVSLRPDTIEEAEFFAIEESLNQAREEKEKARPVEKKRQRSHEETRARQLSSRLLDKVEALQVRNNYLLNILDREVKNSVGNTDVIDIKKQIENVHDFNDSMDVIERLLSKVETRAYQNGFLRARLDAISTETELLSKLHTAEEAVKRLTEQLRPRKAAERLEAAPPMPTKQRPEQLYPTAGTISIALETKSQAKPAAATLTQPELKPRSKKVGAKGKRKGK
jgi:hypothetical protein